jgi:hypothetical protein
MSFTGVPEQIAGMLQIASVRTLLRWVGRHELGSLLAVIVVSVGTWVFVEVTDAVRDGETQSLDRTLLLRAESSSLLRHTVALMICLDTRRADRSPWSCT